MSHTSYTTTTPSVTETSSEALASKATRSSLEIINTGSNTVYLAFGATATTGGLPLAAGESWYPSGPCPTNAVAAICAGGESSTLLILEG